MLNGIRDAKECLALGVLLFNEASDFLTIVQYLKRVILIMVSEVVINGRDGPLRNVEISFNI